MARSIRSPFRLLGGRRNAASARRPALIALMILPALAGPGATRLRADYTFKPLGTMGYLYSEPASINDVGQVCGTLTGT